MNYDIITASTYKFLIQRVSTFLKENIDWELAGGVACDGRYFYQAVVKKDQIEVSY